MDIVTLYRREDGKFAWRRQDGGNFEILATDAGQGYEHRQDNEAIARRVNGPDCEYRDET